MDVNPENVQAMARYLEQTLSSVPATRKEAEKFLQEVELNKNYALLLLKLMDEEKIPMHIRVSASITFKNFIKRHWRADGLNGDQIHADDRAAIKTNIVGLMLKSPENTQKQLSEAISVIGREDFPDNWKTLIPEMVKYFETGDFHIINGVLRTAHSIFKRYRHEFKSNELWKEIKYVLDNFAAPLTELFKNTMDLAQKHASNTEALKVIFSSLVLIAKIFNSLNAQDLPEFFEDNMAVWMDHFLNLLSVHNALLVTNDEDDMGLLEQLKAQICENVSMYAQKYDEEFSPYLGRFVDVTWHLLLNTGAEPKYDLLVSTAIKFLASVAERPRNKQLFAEPAVLQTICEKVIVPNMEFRPIDEELFEDNPEEFIRRDIEGSDVDTRRRAACDLVRALCAVFEGPVIQNFSGYIKQLFDRYAADPKNNWHSEDVALYLIVTLAARAQTQKHGATKTSELVNIVDVFNQHILPLLQQDDVNAMPVLKADALKYLVTFRSTLPVEVLEASVPLVGNMLRADSIVVHTYAAHALERALMLRDAQQNSVLNADKLAPHAETLLGLLVAVFSKQGSEENEYVMKAMLRLCSALKTKLLAYVEKIINFITEKIVAVSKNPSKPHFNHYLFETLSLCIRVACTANPAVVESFEQGIFPIFQLILENDVQEFTPYVFQILSLLLELRTDALPAVYLQLMPHLLTPLLWERPGNIPPLVRLLQAIITRGGEQIAGSDKLNPLLGVFQKLIASKSNDHQGFYLIEAMIEHVPQNVMSQYLKSIFTLLFQRFGGSKTTKFHKNLIVFFSLFTIKYGATELINVIDSVQSKMWSMVVQKVIIDGVRKVSGSTERKMAAVAITRMLTEAPAMITTDYVNHWTPLLQVLLEVFELPEDDSLPADEHFIEIEDTPGYQTAYSQLVFAGQAERNPLGTSVPDAKVYLAKQLHAISNQHPDKVKQLISSMPQASTTCLQAYFTAAGIAL